MSVLLNCLITQSHYLTVTENGCCKVLLPIAGPEKQRKAGASTQACRKGWLWWSTHVTSAPWRLRQEIESQTEDLSQNKTKCHETRTEVLRPSVAFSNRVARKYAISIDTLKPARLREPLGSSRPGTHCTHWEGRHRRIPGVCWPTCVLTDSSRFTERPCPEK